jgi:DNA-binding protein YbaB
MIPGCLHSEICYAGYLASVQVDPEVKTDVNTFEDMIKEAVNNARKNVCDILL